MLQLSCAVLCCAVLCFDSQHGRTMASQLGLWPWQMRHTHPHACSALLGYRLHHVAIPLMGKRVTLYNCKLHSTP